MSVDSLASLDLQDRWDLQVHKASVETLEQPVVLELLAILDPREYQVPPAALEHQDRVEILAIREAKEFLVSKVNKANVDSREQLGCQDRLGKMAN